MTRHELEDERTFLLRSLEDLDREHEAGDLSDEDHAVLRDGYVARAAAVLRTLDGASLSPDGSTDGPRRSGRDSARPSPLSPAGATGVSSRRRQLLVTAGVVVVVGCVVWAVVAHLGARLPGESVTGSVTLSGSEATERSLAQAETLESQGDDVDALKLYQAVLRQDPTEEEALAEVGWLEYEAGARAKNSKLLSLGQQQELKAERVAPAAFAPHLYLGSMLLAEGDSAGAVAQYRQFLTDHPPRSNVTAAEPFIIKAFSAAHLALPALPAGGAASG
jgi:tetratricopeptide (TPR) repeat protein